MTNKTSLKKAIAESAEGYPLLGWVLYWSTNGFREETAKVRAVLNQVGIDEEYARLVAPSTALQAAFDIATIGSQGIRKHAVKAENKTILCLVRGQAQGTDVLFQSICQGHLNGEDAVVQGEGAEQILEEFSTRKNVYTNTQFVGLVKSYIAEEAGSLTLRDHGGVYFIPAHKAQEFERVVKLFEAFPAASLDVLPVIDTAQAKRSVWAALTADVEGEIGQLQSQIEVWNSEGDPRDGVVQRRLEEYARLKEKVEDYAYLLSGTASDLQKKLDAVAKALREKL